MTRFNDHMTPEDKAALREAGERILQAERKRARMYAIEIELLAILDFLDDPPSECSAQALTALEEARDWLRVDLLMAAEAER